MPLFSVSFFQEQWKLEVSNQYSLKLNTIDHRWTKPRQVYLHNNRGLKFDLNTNKQKYHRHFCFAIYMTAKAMFPIYIMVKKIWFWFSGEQYSTIIVLLAITCRSIRTTRLLYFWSAWRRKFEKAALVVYPP